jgi:hypothetical protein
MTTMPSRMTIFFMEHSLKQILVRKLRGLLSLNWIRLSTVRVVERVATEGAVHNVNTSMSIGFLGCGTLVLVRAGAKSTASTDFSGALTTQAYSNARAAVVSDPIADDTMTLNE